MDKQSKQLKEELETIYFESNDIENKIIDAEIILENFKIFKDVFDHLTINENMTCCTYS